MSTGITEKEAATKWCPFTRVGIYAGPALAAVNRHPSDDSDRPDIKSETRCLGSGCALWRWNMSAEDPASYPGTDRRGYCGLAARGHTA